MATEITYEEPRAAKWLFASTGAAWIWLVARIWLGYQWAHAGWEKLTGTEAAHWYTWHFAYTHDSWLRSAAGLKGFAAYAASQSGKPLSAVNYGWYAAFLRWIERDGSWLAPLIALGEFAIGLALIVGLFTGIAAFFGGMLTMSFGLAGVSGVNPVFFLFEVMLILAWRNAGYYGLDRYVLPALGTPWQRGRVFQHKGSPASVPA
jgi:thiosulfate dehydrogenase [quinone] large subunit